MPKFPPIGRFMPLLVLALGCTAVFALGLDDYLTFAELRQRRAWLAQQVEAHYLLSLAAFMGIYVVTVAFSVPGAAVLTVAGGFLFGAFVSTALVLVAATAGATLLFLAARTALHDVLRARAGPWLAKLERGFAENALGYLLVLRLIPLFPFFVVNLAPALIGVRLRVFVLGTFIGIIPGTFVYANVGAGLGGVLASGDDFSLDSVLTPQILVALLGLALLSLLPFAYKRLRRRKRDDAA